MNCLVEKGLADNTIIVYSSDHGDWLGDHGLVLKGPMHYEGLLPTRAGVELSLQTVRTRTTKLTKDMISGGGEMYDLATDPHEMTNLYDDPAHAAMRAGLEALIDSRADDMIPLQPQVGLA